MGTLTRRQLGASALALGASALLPRRAPRAAEPLTVRIGFASVGIGGRQFAGGSTAGLAHAEGYLERELADTPEVKIEWSFFKGAGPAVNEAIANGQLDLAHQGDLPSILGRANGLKTKILLMSRPHTPTYVAVPAGSELRGLEDLKGRKVAIHRGTNMELAFAKALAARGLTERDLKLINMDDASMNAALATRDIDAAVGEMPLFEVEKRGLARIAYTTKGDDPAFGRNTHVLATEAFEREHPEVVGRIVRAFVRAARWASEEANRPALLGIWSRSGVPAEAFGEDFAGEEMRYRCSPLLDPFMVGQYRVQAEQTKALGLVRREVDTGGWLDPRHLEAALRDLGLERYWTRYDEAGRPLDA